MIGRTVLCCLLPVVVWGADTTVSISIRGHNQLLARISPESASKNAAVLFLPGDGGWRGAAVTMARTIASWGYDAYGFDTKKYLETFSQNGGRLSRDQMAEDVRALARQVGNSSGRPVILVGWSQGAGMAIAAGAGFSDRHAIRGVVTLGLPESAVLGWDWKATLSIIARREPDQPKFEVKPLLAQLTPTPIWMIHASEDEYTSTASARELFRAARDPKRLEEIAGGDHDFGGRRDLLFRSIEKGLEWIAGL